jgi:hypothetical protein
MIEEIIHEQCATTPKSRKRRLRKVTPTSGPIEFWFDLRYSGNWISCLVNHCPGCGRNLAKQHTPQIEPTVARLGSIKGGVDDGVIL